MKNKCARCSAETINSKLLCEPCLAKRRAEIAARGVKHSQKGRIDPGSHYEPTPEEIAAGVAAIQARWSDAEYYHRAGCLVPNADTPIVDRGLTGRVLRTEFIPGS